MIAATRAHLARFRPSSWRGWVLLAILAALGVGSAWSLTIIVRHAVREPSILIGIGGNCLLGALLLWWMYRMDRAESRVKLLAKRVAELEKYRAVALLAADEQQREMDSLRDQMEALTLESGIRA